MPIRRAVLGLLLFAAMTLQPLPSGAIDSSVFDSSSGTFDNPSRDDALAIECLQYGTGDPATFTPVGASDPSIQVSTPGVTNQVRFGRIPAAFGGGCSSDPGASTGTGSSGFGFDGASAATLIGDGFEMGRFTHFNRTIERGAARVQLLMTFAFDGPGGPFASSVSLDVDLDETSDFSGVADTSLCEFDVPENATISTPFTATLCADRITIQPLASLAPPYGETELDLEVSRFARVVGNVCDESNVIEGDAFFSAEQMATELCIIGRFVGGTIAIEATVQGGPGQVVDYGVTEHDQRSSPPAAGTLQPVQVDASSGSGTSGPRSLEAGLYLLSEVGSNPAAVGPPTCVTDGVDATVEIDGVRYLDLDSGENVVCSFVYDVTVTTTAAPTTAAPTTAAPTTAVVPAPPASEPVTTATTVGSTSTAPPTTLESTATSAPPTTGAGSEASADLPSTGASVLPLLVVALLLVLAGLAALVLSYRRAA